MIRSVLILSPEPPYPLHGGGPFRIASLIHYFARFAAVDLILISESGRPALLPPGLVRKQTVIPLPVHDKGVLARYTRNARRALLGVPPLIDRLSGLGGAITRAIGRQKYDLGLIEHFWCAPYIDELGSACRQTVLDLHNIESVLHERCALLDHGPIAAAHRRFSRTSAKIEGALLPRFSEVLATSQCDADTIARNVPGCQVAVYPNALPWVNQPQVNQPHSSDQTNVVFSGNFEYHPNIDAVRFLTAEIWPEVNRRHPELRLRLVGRGDSFVRDLLPSGLNIEVTGPVPDAFAEIAKAKVVLAPLRAGSGTRIKILEAWAAARPVIATPLAAEGLLAQDRRNILFADDAAGFADAIDMVLLNPIEGERLGALGRQSYTEHYTWDVAWRALDGILQPSSVGRADRYTG